MAQAAYTDPNAPSKRKAQQLQEQSRQRIAQRASGNTGSITDGITPRPAVGADPGMAGTATQAEYDAAVQRQRSARSGAVTRPVQASTLTPDEAAAFDRQTGGNFSKKFPQAPTVANAQARTNAPAVPRAATPSIADDLVPQPPAQTAGPRVNAGRVARFGAQPVQTVPGRVAPRTAPGQRGGAGALLATSAIMSAADSVTTPTSDYRKRFGMAPSGGLAGDLAARTGGVLTDLGAGLVDNLVIAPGNALGRIAQAAGADPNGALGRQATYLRDEFDDVEANNAAAAAGGAAAAGKPDFSDVLSGSSSTADRNTPAARRAANGGITPVADRTGAPDEVLGTFNGRAITRAQSDELANNQSFGGSTSEVGSIAEGLRDYQPPRGGGGQGQAALIGGSGSGSEARVKDLTDSSTAAGKLYQELLRDKTPTGKRVAAQFASEYVGTGAAERGQDKDLEGRQGSDATTLQRGREGDAAQLEGERIRNRGNKQRQYVFNEDGTIGQLTDGILSPVTDAKGKPARASVKGKTAGAMSPKEREELVTERLKQLDPNNELTTEERAAARNQVLAELQQLSDELELPNG